MEIKIELNRLASLSKRMLEHQNRAKNLQHSLERETGKASSILSRSEFPPPFSGQISATKALELRPIAYIQIILAPLAKSLVVYELIQFVLYGIRCVKFDEPGPQQVPHPADCH